MLAKSQKKEEENARQEENEYWVYPFLEDRIKKSLFCIAYANLLKNPDNFLSSIAYFRSIAWFQV